MGILLLGVPENPNCKLLPSHFLSTLDRAFLPLQQRGIFAIAVNIARLRRCCSENSQGVQAYRSHSHCGRRFEGVNYCLVGGFHQSAKILVKWIISPRIGAKIIKYILTPPTSCGFTAVFLKENQHNLKLLGGSSQLGSG